MFLYSEMRSFNLYFCYICLDQLFLLAVKVEDVELCAFVCHPFVKCCSLLMGQTDG